VENLSVKNKLTSFKISHSLAYFEFRKDNFFQIIVGGKWFGDSYKSHWISASLSNDFSPLWIAFCPFTAGRRVHATREDGRSLGRRTKCCSSHSSEERHCWQTKL